MAFNLVKKIVSAFFIAIAVLMFPFLSRAETKESKESNAYCEIDSSVKYLPGRRVKTVGGKVGIIKSDFTYKYGFKAFGKLPVEMWLGTGYMGIDNTVESVELPARLVGLSTGIETTLPFFNFNNTYFRLGVEPSFYADSWDFPASSFRIPNYYYVIYRPNSKWTFLCGVAVYPDFVDPVFPIVGFIYKPNDKLVFHIAPRRPNITYALTDKVSLFCEGSFALNNEFEVKKDDYKNVILAYHETYLGAGIKYKLNRYIQASLSSGGSFRRRLKYEDSLGKIDIKDGLYTEFRIEIKS